MQCSLRRDLEASSLSASFISLDIIPQPSMATTSSTKTADYDLDTLIIIILLDAQAEPLLDNARWKENGAFRRKVFFVNGVSEFVKVAGM